ncbi:MAG: N-acetylglucosamine-6-phosphate deacetylase [Chitinophagaceae bacterium]|jgi:N-acetylglucosamine-6-phosphate deacetylase|nr:N-acetylglucosamine-6-phosphate deacetylase [Chitinophagaceae bacterium]
MITAFKNATIFNGEKELKDCSMLVKDNTVLDFVSNNSIPSDASIIDFSEKFIAPGLIDLQIYGAGGYLFSNKPSAEALHSMTEAIIKTGTTGFMITLATNSVEVFSHAIQVVKKNPHPAILGLHFEGPWLNPEKKGAHIEKYIKKPSIKEVQDLINEAGDILKMVTLAPEIAGDEIIRLLRTHNIIVSAGHSNANFEEAVNGYHSGVQMATHLFNAMSPMHHRNTGLPGATFLSDHAMASIIADGVHVDFETLKISKKLMQDRLFLITDAVEEVLEGAYVHVKQTDRYTLPDGTLSGSQLTLLQAVNNCIQYVGITKIEALRMASSYPARLLGDTNRGNLSPGSRADFIVLDNKLTLHDVYLLGNHQKKVS